VAYTIFDGDQIEKIDLEVIGVLHNAVGPKLDVILVRLLGDKVQQTGVVAGMSGSPVYIDGKLVGALSLKFGTFVKDPLAGITPIEDMLSVPTGTDPAKAASATAASATGAATEKASLAPLMASIRNPASQSARYRLP